MPVFFLPFRLHRKPLRVVTSCLLLSFMLSGTTHSEPSQQNLTPLYFAYGKNGFPPFYYMDEKQRFTGISVELIQEFLQPKGYTLTPRRQPRLRQPAQFRSEELDVAFLNPRWLPKDVPVIFSSPFITYKEAFFSPSIGITPKQSTLNTQSYDWLYDKTLCTHIGYTYSDRLENLFKTRKVVRYDSPTEEQMIKMLSARRCDFMLGDLVTITWQTKRLGLSDRINSIPASDGNWPVMVTLHRKHAHLIAPLNSFINNSQFAERRQALIDTYLKPTKKTSNAPFTLNIPAKGK